MDDKKSNLGSHISNNDKYVPQSPLPMPAETSKDAEKMQKELDDFKKKVVKKFPFTVALSMLPAQSFKLFEEDEGMLPEEIARKPLHLLFIIPEDEYKNIQKKIKPEIVKIIQESKQNVWVHIKTPVDVWNYGLDSKFDLVDAVSSSYPLYDKGFLGALRVANIHKTLVLRKFEKYVASYVIGGSLARGTADKESDVDTFVVIDDTDVKKMPRLQLLEKLRGFIYDYIREANALAGVKNILNVQVYLLTDFWQSVKDATPVIFTFIRDGVPMYDRGTFLPWKLLLKMGKIKPSPEAVDTFMKYGDQNESLVKRRLMDAMIDIYWGVITPTQALMMLAGHAPPVPKTMVQEVKQVFIDKEKIMGMKELKILEKVVKMYKDYEHGKLTSVSGEEIDTLLKESKHYDTKLKELRKKLETRMIEHTAEAVHKEVFELLTSLFGTKAKNGLISSFETNLVKQGKMQKRFLPVLKEVSKLDDKKFVKKLDQNSIDVIRRDSGDLINALVEFAQRKEIAAIEKGIFKVSYGEKFAELVLTDAGVFFIDQGAVKKVTSSGLHASKPEELDEAMKTIKDRKALKLSWHVLESLKKAIGDFEIVN
jgi:predicted nucleotidyltransferase